MIRTAWIFLIALFLASSGLGEAAEISPDGRDLLADGERVFLNAATPWHILARLDREEAIRYLDAREAMGFNGLLLSVLVHEDFQTGTTANAFGDKPFLADDDFSRPNEAYFAHVDWFLQEAASRDFWILLAPAYLGYDCAREGFCGAMQENGVDVMREYGRWIGSRYRDVDRLVWVNAGDADAGAHGALDAVSAVAEGIREASPDQLQTAHCNRQNSAADCYDLPWLDLNNTYSDCASTPERLREDWERSPTRPFFYLEGWYEGEHATSPVCLRSQAYWAVLGGAFGHCFGNNPLWDFQEGWEEALLSPGTRSMKAFGELFRSRSHARLVPDWSHHVLTAGYGNPGDGSFAGAAISEDGTTVIVYTPERRSLTVDTRRIEGNHVVAWWFNPALGTTVYLGTWPAEGPHDFTPPFDGDWVLVLDAESAELPAPGRGIGAEGPVSIGEVKNWFYPR